MKQAYAVFRKHDGGLHNFQKLNKKEVKDFENHPLSEMYKLREVTYDQAAAILQWNHNFCLTYHGDANFEEDVFMMDWSSDA